MGLLNGLLGMGGAFIAIPILTEALTKFGLSAKMVHLMAIGTAPATILITVVSSFLTYKKSGTVRFDIIKKCIFYIFLGSFSGSILATYTPTALLKIVYSTLGISLGLWTLFPTGKAGERKENLRFIRPLSVFFGVIASMTGIAGTMLCLTWLNYRGVEWRQSVATSSGIGLITSSTSTISYIFAGLNVPNLPEYSLGYIYLPGLFCLIIPSIIFAKVGAKLLSWRKMPLGLLKKSTGVLNIIIAIKIASTIF